MCFSGGFALATAIEDTVLAPVMSQPAIAAGFGKRAHSVLTAAVRDEPGHPALAARQRTVTFLRQHLAPTP